jgi:hypothetical protein
MTKETQPKPQIISVNTRQFQKDLEKHNKWLEYAYQSVQWLEQETKVSIGIEDLTVDNALNVFLSFFKKRHEKENTLDLSAIKLADLKEIDLTRIISIFDTSRIKNYAKPILKDYEMYATTPQEIERLKIAQDFLEIMGKLGTQVMFSNVLMAPVKRDVNTGKAIVNHHWIKGVR